jgi:pimeloyl-ACP methyl ester carboxylesterase
MSQRDGTQQQGSMALTCDQARARLVAAIPAAERRLELAGVSTAVLDGGDGPPLVLLHGGMQFAATWIRVIPALMATHRVIAPDLPGHGASEVPDGRLDADRVLAWLDELIERSCPSPPALVGHTLGGAISARYAIGHGERISLLVLVDALGLDPFHPIPRFALAMVGLLAQPTEHTRDRFLGQCILDLEGVHDQMGEAWELIATYGLDGARNPHKKAAGRSLMKAFGVSAIPQADLARIRVPTALIWGRHDLQARLQVAEFASARHGWPLHVIEDCGVEPNLEQPHALLGALRAELDGRRTSA